MDALPDGMGIVIYRFPKVDKLVAPLITVLLQQMHVLLVGKFAMIEKKLEMN